MPVVPGKPGNAPVGKRLQFEGNAGEEGRTDQVGVSLADSVSVREPEMALQSESEESPGIPVLRADRQAMAAGIAGSGLASGLPKRRAAA